jgi:hypothetical protein
MSFALKKVQSSRGISSDLSKGGGKTMKRCMITITTLQEDDTGETVILDISKRGVSVNCPKTHNLSFFAKSLKPMRSFTFTLKIPV